MSDCISRESESGEDEVRIATKGNFGVKFSREDGEARRGAICAVVRLGVALRRLDKLELELAVALQGWEGWYSTGQSRVE